MITSKPQRGAPIAGNMPATEPMERFMFDVQNALSYQNTEITGDVTITVGGFYRVNANSGPVNVTLGNRLPNGYPSATIKKIDGSANAVTVTPESGQIDGAASLSWAVQYQSYTIYPGDGNWWIV